MDVLASLSISAIAGAVGWIAFGLVGSTVQNIVEKVKDKKETSNLKKLGSENSIGYDDNFYQD